MRFRILPEQIRANKILMVWGRFRFMYGHAVFYVGVLQLLLIAATAYNTTLQPWVVEYLGWNITFWQYCLVLLISVTIGMWIEFLVSVPALIAVSNEQMYKHQSPIKTDFDDVKKKQAELESKLDRIIAKLESKEHRLQE